jgi:hypothetical protein
MAKVITEKGTKGFYLWLKANQPKLYAEVVRRTSSAAHSLHGFGDTITDPYTGVVYDTSGSPAPTAVNDPATTATATPPSSSLADSIKNLIMGASQIFLAKKQLDTQGEIIDTQLARAKAGLPPLNINPASYGLQPTIGVGLTSGTQNLVIYGGLAALALVALGIFRPRRR